MDAALKVGVIGDDVMEQHAMTRIVEFMGHEVTPIPACDVAMASGKDCLTQIPASTPLLYVGDDVPLGRTVIASIDRLGFHQLQSALHEVRTILCEQLHERQVDQIQLARLPGHSQRMAGVRSLLAGVAPRDVPVRLVGEAGTGKEFTARLLHASSNRSSRPFVPLNCGAIVPELVEIELLGHERGAFPGALTARAGRIELAEGGTLYLEEPGTLPHPVQLQLLRVLQSRQVTRLGAQHGRAVDVRVVVADQGGLEAQVRNGTFREDLYDHLSAFSIEMPALRERPEDIPLLVDAICAVIESEQRLVLTLSVDVMEALRRYTWPGNIRELKNLLQRLAIQCRGEVVTTRDLPTRVRDVHPPVPREARVQEVVLSDVPEAVRLPVNGMDLKDYLSRLERSLIEQALDDADSVVARAADRLHVRRTTLVEKMRKYGISR